tara:strand:+ start:295 stop:579 length:285 start_codon:yes stop_codon:yes gene_type:complete
MEFLALIGVVATILNIILFFKVWGMTNNVVQLTKIAQKFTNMEYLTDEMELVQHDENKKLKKEKERIRLDSNIDHAERIKLTEEIEKKIKDTIL